MTTLTANPAYSAFEVLGLSSTSSQGPIHELVRKQSEHFDEPATRQKNRESFDAVFEVYSTHCEPGWDGYNANPLSQAAFKEAVEFLRKLPSTILFPEVVAEPDGDISLEWYMGNNFLFAVSFAGKGLISYAGTFGRGPSVHGREFVSESIPQSILENIRRVLLQR